MADIGKSWPVLIVCGGLVPLFLSIVWLLLIRHFVAAMPWITVVLFNMLLISVTIFYYLKGWFKKKIKYLLCFKSFGLNIVSFFCSWMDWEWCCNTYHRWAWPILSCIWSSKFHQHLLSSTLNHETVSLSSPCLFVFACVPRSWLMSEESPFWWLSSQLLLSSLQSPSSAVSSWLHQSSR